ncbi:MAG TPA: hypothetical protein VNU97_18825 [Rhizomicrobium sp.]|jgi:hypothetical protein|nr:hypothetical protein [Rhizomicrobium sp.]
MRRALVLAVLLTAFAGPALAAETPGDPGTNVEMPFLIAPMSKDGKLLGYSYISSKLVAASQGAALEIRDKIAFIQDAFVRDVNAAPTAVAADPTVIDRVLLANRLIADARRVVGAAKVTRIVFGDGDKDPGIQFSPLHPTQTPQRADQMTGAPPPAPPPAAAPAAAQSHP